MAQAKTEPFHGHLSGEKQKWLASNIGPRPKNFRLLYSARRDKCSPDAFHSHCDNKGPTVTVLYNLNGTIYGGYTSKSWTQADGVYEPDSLAFLFQLEKDGQSSFKKIPCIDTEHAIYRDQTKAAVFGRGHDLHLMNRPTALGDSGTFALDGEINFLSYFLEGVDKAEFCNNTLDATEIKVYSVSDAPISTVSEEKVPVSSTKEEGEDDAITDEAIIDVEEKMKTSGPKVKGKDFPTAGLQSELLPAYKKRLTYFIGLGNKRFQLLYSATKDEFSVKEFHKKCDNKGPTVTVLSNGEHDVFGGYTSKGWAEVERGYVSDPTAFLFHLKKDEQSWRYDKFPCSDTNYAIFCDPKRTAVFGKRPDLHSTSMRAHWNHSRTLPSGVAININSYDMKNVDLAFLCNAVTKIEVHKVKDAKDSGRLSPEQKMKLAKHIGREEKIFELLYSATKDTCSPEAFHRQCDGKEPTVTVLYGKGNSVFGGYTSMSWAVAKRGYVWDPEAFLFQLKKDGTSFTTFKCKDKNYAIFCDPSKAAVFGEGPDLHLMNGPITWNESGTFKLDGKIKFRSYDMQGVDKAGFCNAALEVEEIEVYTITDPDSDEDVPGGEE